MEVLESNPTGLQSQIPWGFPVPLQAWKHEAQNLHTSGRTFLVLLFSSFLVSHLTGMGFIFIVLEHLLHLTVVSSLCLDLGHPFLVGSRVLLWMVVHQLVAISLLLREEISACPSTLPS